MDNEQTTNVPFIPTRDQWERSQAAVRALTAQLAAKDAELSEFRLAMQRDILSRLGATTSQFAALTAERDAARAEVARLTAANNQKRRALEKIQSEGFLEDASFGLLDEVAAALRGDTAPAGRE